MRTHFISGLLAAVFMATAGTGGALLHLCGMQGEVLSTCCCHSESTADTLVEVGSADDCCGDSFFAAGSPLAKTESKESASDPIQLTFVAAITTGFESRSAELDHDEFLSHGSPPGVGPPIYIRDCSFLI